MIVYIDNYWIAGIYKKFLTNYKLQEEDMPLVQLMKDYLDIKSKTLKDEDTENCALTDLQYEYLKASEDNG